MFCVLNLFKILNKFKTLAVPTFREILKLNFN